MQNFWINKKVLITGHSGFKGMWLAVILNIFGAKVYGLSDFSVISKIYEKINGKKFFEKEFKVDISKDIKTLKKIFNQNEFDVIFHFAAQALVYEAQINPLKTLETNIIGTFNIISEIQNSECTDSLIVASTDKVYKFTDQYNDEKASLGGNEFYSASKVSAENIIDAFVNTNKTSSLKISTVRSGNVLGGGDGAKGRLLTDIVDAAKKGEKIYLRNPIAIRPWQDVLDSLSGYLKVAEFNFINKNVGQFNLNSDLNSKLTVGEIVNLVLEIWESKIEIVENSEEHFFETNFLRLNSSKARDVLGWKETVEIEEMITKIVNWEKADSESAVEKVTISQINKYFQ